jgi:hypothetical protein
MTVDESRHQRAALEIANLRADSVRRLDRCTDEPDAAVRGASSIPSENRWCPGPVTVEVDDTCFRVLDQHDTRLTVVPRTHAEEVTRYKACGRKAARA